MSGGDMFAINGVDYTFHIIAISFVILSIAVYFTAQYLLCKKAKKLTVKLIPAYAVLLLIVLAGLVAVSGTGGSVIDLRSFVALVILCYAAICAVSAGLAWLIYKLKRKNEA